MSAGPPAGLGVPDRSTHEQRRASSLSGCHTVPRQTMSAEAALGQLRLNKLAMGQDGRNRCLLSPFRPDTGRNQPSNTQFIVGPSRWIRGLIRPPQGYGLAYIDF